MPTKVCKPQAAADFLQGENGYEKWYFTGSMVVFGVCIKNIAICDSISVRHIYLLVEIYD